MSDSGEYYRITCRFCDTIITVTEEQAGAEVRCPDCFSMLDVGDLAKKRGGKPEGRGGKPEGRGGKPEGRDEKAQSAGKDEQDGEELKLSETFERPAISPLFGLDASEQDLLAPRKKRPADDPDADGDSAVDAANRMTKSSESKSPASARSSIDSKPASSDLDLAVDLDVDEPLPVDEVLSLDAIGKLVPASEPAADDGPTGDVPAADRRRRSNATKQKNKRSRREPAEPKVTEVHRPEFKPASLFMATVGMLSDVRVLAVSAVAVLIMLIGGFSSEAIFPVGSDTEVLTITESMYKYFTSFLFGGVPYLIGVLVLWTVAGFVFRDAVQGHAKFQGWTAGGQASFWPTFLLFGFSFFIAGLPGSIVFVLIIPLRMMVAPLFLISAWYNGSPWQIVSSDWYHVVNKNKSQWITFYGCFVALAFAGLMTGLVFLARSFSDLMAVDLALTAIGICMNTLITLVFAALAGWHVGAVIECLEQND